MTLLHVTCAQGAMVSCPSPARFFSCTDILYTCHHRNLLLNFCPKELTLLYIQPTATTACIMPLKTTAKALWRFFFAPGPTRAFQTKLEYCLWNYPMMVRYENCFFATDRQSSRLSCKPECCCLTILNSSVSVHTQHQKQTIHRHKWSQMLQTTRREKFALRKAIQSIRLPPRFLHLRVYPP